MPHRVVAPASVAIALAAAVLTWVCGAAAPAAAAPPLPLRYQFHVGMDVPVRMPFRWNAPYLDLEVGPDGTRYALDRGSRRVLRYAVDGRLINAWGWPGNGPGEFGDDRTSIDVGPTGDVFVGDPANGRVQQFTAWGAFVADVCLGGRAVDGTCAPDLSNRTAMAVLPDGRFVVGTRKVADGRDVGGDLTVYRPDGALERTWTTVGIHALESDSRGRIVAAEPSASRVEVFDPDGTLLATHGRRAGDGKPTDPGTFDLCHGSCAPFGGCEPSWECNPRDLAIGPDDSIYVNIAGERITRFLPDGRAVEALRTGLQTLAVGPDGTIVVAYDAQLFAWSADGTPGPTWTLDPPLLSPPPDGPSGAFFDPVAVAPVAGGAVMSDAGAGALQWLGPRGELGQRQPTNPCNGGAQRGVASALAPAPDGGLLAAFEAEGCVQFLSADGVPGRTWGRAGAAPHAFGPLSAVAELADDGFLVADPENGRLLAFGPDGAWRGEWGAGEFAARPLRNALGLPTNEPIDLAPAPGGTVVALDVPARRIVRFGQDGRIVQAWSVAPHILRANGLGIGPDGTVYVTDSEADHVGRFTPDGAWLGAIGADAGLAFPTAVAVTAAGRILVSDPGWRARFQSGRVVVMEADGTAARPWLGKVAGDEFGIKDLLVLDNGEVLALENNTMLRLDNDGNILSSVKMNPGVYNHVGIAPRAGGSLLVIGGGRTGPVAEVAPDGALRRTWRSTRSGPGSLDRPTGIAAGTGPDGVAHLWVADADGGRVARFSWDGAFEREWTDGPDGVPLGAVAQLAVAPDGSVWVADPDHDRVAHFTADGVPLGAIGAAADAADGLLEPTGVAVTADGTIIVADTGHGRLQAYGVDGTLVAAWDGGDAPGTRLREPVGLALAQEDGTLWVADREANRVVAFAAAPPTAWHVRYYRDDGLMDGPVFIESAAGLDLDWGGAPPAAGLPATGFGLRTERPAGLPDGDRLLTLALRGGAALFAPFGRAPLVVAGDPAVRAAGTHLRADDWLRIDFAARAAHPMLRLGEGNVHRLFFPSALRDDG